MIDVFIDRRVELIVFIDNVIYLIFNSLEF